METSNQKPSSTESRIIVAFDVSNYAAAIQLARRMDPKQYRAAKVGKELFTAAGPGVVEDLIKAGIDVFLDLKFHDIPNTVAGAVRAACGLGVWMMNVHALGGKEMLEAAANELAKMPVDKRPLGVGVTLLTSMGQAGMDQVGLNGDPAACVLRLAGLVRTSGLDGVGTQTNPKSIFCLFKSPISVKSPRPFISQEYAVKPEALKKSYSLAPT